MCLVRPDLGAQALRKQGHHPQHLQPLRDRAFGGPRSVRRGAVWNDDQGRRVGCPARVLLIPDWNGEITPMWQLAIKAMLGDRPKLLASLLGVTFSVVLVNLQAGLLLFRAWALPVQPPAGVG